MDLAAVHSRWDKYELMLESHSLMIKEQIEVMKGGVESRKEALLVSVQKFASRWDALKPKDGALDKPDQALAAICKFNSSFLISILSNLNCIDSHYQGEALRI